MGKNKKDKKDKKDKNDSQLIPSKQFHQQSILSSNKISQAQVLQSQKLESKSGTTAINYDAQISKQLSQSKENRHKDHQMHKHNHHHHQHGHKQHHAHGEDKYPHYTWEQVGKHDHKDDLWVVIENQVFNLTKVVEKYPKDSKLIVHRAGKCATKAFASGSHLLSVFEQYLPKNRIGTIKEDSMIQSWQRQEKTGKMDSFMAIAIAISILSFMGYMIN